MTGLSKQILDLLEGVNDKEALKALAEVVSSYDLQVAANLVRENHEPGLTKGYLEEHYYSEGNTESGHLPLLTILREIEDIINCDKEEKDIQFTSCFVRRYTKEELVEEGKQDDEITWYKPDETQKVKGKFIGFDAK